MKFLLFFLLGCQSSDTKSADTKQQSSSKDKPNNLKIPVKPPQKIVGEIVIKNKKSLGHVDFFASADSDGDGKDEIYKFTDGKLKWDGNIVAIPANPVVAGRGDIDGDGKEEALLALGSGKKFRDASKQVWSLNNQEPKQIWEQVNNRNNISDMHIVENQIFIVSTNDLGEMESAWIRDGTYEPIQAKKLGLRQYPLTATRGLIGRVYGDAPRSDGDLWIYEGGVSTGKQIPSFRGIRAITMSDMNADGHKELLFADGWHYQYGHQARARVRLHHPPDYQTGRTLSDFPKDYTVNRIEVHRANPKMILVQGSRHAYLLYQDEIGWRNLELCKINETGNAIFHYEKNTTSVLCSGRQATQVFIQ